MYSSIPTVDIITEWLGTACTIPNSDFYAGWRGDTTFGVTKHAKSHYSPTFRVRVSCVFGPAMRALIEGTRMGCKRRTTSCSLLLRVTPIRVPQCTGSTMPQGGRWRPFSVTRTCGPTLRLSLSDWGEKDLDAGAPAACQQGPLPGHPAVLALTAANLVQTPANLPGPFSRLQPSARCAMVGAWADCLRGIACAWVGHGA